MISNERYEKKKTKHLMARNRLYGKLYYCDNTSQKKKLMIWIVIGQS